MRYESIYQTALIVFALLVVFAIGLFLYHEVFPEYKTYQLAYKELENFRASYTEQTPAPFISGIKQIVIPDPQQGPEIIDRCTSCHVAMNFPHFSPTKIALDVNDNPRIDTEGLFVLEKNPNYIFARLDKAIEEAPTPQRKKALEKLKSVTQEGKQIELSRVLKQHPLIGEEKKPFEFHSLEEYGCTSCHSGNGRALVAKRAHGPVFDGEYEPKISTVKPSFLEKDKKNDPLFSSVYNDEPGHDLIFQTTPILVGPLVVSRCVQCHQSTSEKMKSQTQEIQAFADGSERVLSRIQKGVEEEKEALIALLQMVASIEKKGIDGTLSSLNQRLGDYHLPAEKIDALEGQLSFLKEAHVEGDVMQTIASKIEYLVGPAGELIEKTKESDSIEKVVEDFLKEQDGRDEGVYFAKRNAEKKRQKALTTLNDAAKPLALTTTNSHTVANLSTSVDKLILNYHRGKELYISQACYACHRIEGFSRSSVGPELTMAGYNYPWFIKESMVWPQADLPSSTMPNFKLDHEELADLMTFLMAQRGARKSVSEVDRAIELRAWDRGKKMPWEEPIAPTKIQDLRYAMKVYTTQGCAACHKLEGFDSNVEFAKSENLDSEKKWFYTLFPENALGSEIAKNLVKYADEIDRKLVLEVRKNGIIEEIEKNHPGLIQGFYSNFKFASRAMNAKLVDDPEALRVYKERLTKVLMIYIQEYGMGRDIGPHLNYSGVYRSDAWLLGHFLNPGAYTARSIMPTIPFDATKFYALNHMLRALGEKNRNSLKQMWRDKGFDPALAYNLACASCHGTQRQGNGILSPWIYPIPKNLRNPVFLKNLTKKRAINSIMHGVNGTPMPPWGEVAPEVKGEAVFSESEVTQLVDWLYQGLPSSVLSDPEEDYAKWSYSPADVVKEMKKEKALLPPLPQNKEDLVEYYFVKEKAPMEAPDEFDVNIRTKFFTKQNLEEGEAYFNINCAACHGKEGTGTGQRAATMVEAKPRMLANLPWAQSRDDLRLLRSIKFGVPGTSMVAWGDTTTAEQRMQLVLYIRSLTDERELLDELEKHLYNTFNVAELVILEARIFEYKKLQEIEEKVLALFSQKESLLALEDQNPEEIASVYAQQVEEEKNLERTKKVDKNYLTLIDGVRQLKKIYGSLGETLIAKESLRKEMSQYFDLIQSQPLIFEIKNNKLYISSSEERIQEQQRHLDALLVAVEAEISRLTDSIEKAQQGPHREKLEEYLENRGSLMNLKTKLVQEMALAVEIEKGLLTQKLGF